MDHLAEQIIARTKTMPQDCEKQSKPWRFLDVFKIPQVSYALVTACCILLVVTIVLNNSPKPASDSSVEIAETIDNHDWDEFWNNEEATMFAGL